MKRLAIHPELNFIIKHFQPELKRMGLSLKVRRFVS